MPSPGPSSSTASVTATSPVARLASVLRGRLDSIDCAVLLVRPGEGKVAAQIAELMPRARVHVLGTTDADLTVASDDDPGPVGPRDHVVFAEVTSTRDRAEYLAMIPAPQLIVEVGDRRRNHKLQSFRDLYFFLSAGGAYVVGELDACADPQWDDGRRDNVATVIARLASAISVRSGTERPAGISAELVASTRSVFVEESTAVVVKKLDHLVKLRDDDADRILAGRYGDHWGRELAERPARTFTSRASVIHHGPAPFESPRVFDVPVRHLRRYEDVIAPAFQIAVLGTFVLPDTFRHPHQRVLDHRHLLYASPYHARLKPAYTPATPRRLEGSFYLFDTEHPGHFGHVTTEVLSRVWGWEQAKDVDPDIRPLLSAHGPPATVPGYQREVFDALGISLDDAEVIHPRDVVCVPSLTAATPQFENPFYVDPDIQDTWLRLTEGLDLSTAVEHEKIFVSRHAGSRRSCLQAGEIEKFFAAAGFAILYPEDLPYRRQAQLFARATIIAGFGGSGMFNMLLNPRARIIILTGNGYNAENEHLFAAVNGNEVHYFWGESLVQPGNGHTQLDAARSDFRFDLRRHRRALKHAMR